MTIKEIKEKYNGQYTDIEVYCDKWEHKVGFHTDRIESVDSYSDSTEVLECQLMDKEDYSDSILANVGATWGDYGYDDSDKILVVKIAK